MLTSRLFRSQQDFKQYAVLYLSYDLFKIGVASTSFQVSGDYAAAWADALLSALPGRPQAPFAYLFFPTLPFDGTANIASMMLAAGPLFG